MLESVGYSMFPAIFPGARLSVAKGKFDDTKVGDIVCYPIDGATVAAHRVVGIERESGETIFITRGDAQEKEDRVLGSALAGVVERVEYGLFSYDTNGIIGRGFSALALGNGARWAFARFIARRSARLLFKFHMAYK